MAIDPPSDVVLEVAKAADPGRAAAAAERLNALAGAAAARSEAFTNTLAQTARPATADLPTVGLADARNKLTDKASAASAKATKAETDFEAMLLNGFVNEMMPKDATATFGQGTAGDMWKSMLADQVARQIAKSGSLGIARKLFASHPMAAGESLEKAAQAGATDVHDATQMSANSLSLPSGSRHDDGAFLFSDRKRS